jgi:hypothetical protein
MLLAITQFVPGTSTRSSAFSGPQTNAYSPEEEQAALRLAVAASPESELHPPSVAAAAASRRRDRCENDIETLRDKIELNSSEFV